MKSSLYLAFLSLAVLFLAASQAAAWAGTTCSSYWIRFGRF